MHPLTLEMYLMGREKLYPKEYTLEVRSNAVDLVKRVNNLLNALQLDCPIVTSGWRPYAINMRAGGAKRSLHMSGKAVDLADKGDLLKEKILENAPLLLDYGLWMERPDATPGWCHLDSGIRDSRFVRVFKP